MAFNLRGGLLRNLIGIGVAIAIGLGWWGFSTFKEKADAPDVGECVTVSGTTTDADVEEAECGGDDVLYKVTADDGDCDLESEVNYTVEVNGSDAVDLCLFWEVEPGDCIKEGTTSDEKVDCATNKGTTVAKVVSVEDSADAKCASKQEFAFANKKRDVTVCITPNV
ncbi:hypothetical protein DJ010_04350 [Nocardioides silvaticus]|uniref:Uncharacterized protein n=1 Tax=Nocardioides silvaticus TaxID=2201891 RepID=A0A316TMG4_9ACTN|nr:hypothetical protein [Nocardioides silvaticus]PWN04841.1 hypothetical protein DJ010_04350 [Nocardioides silvaticus]